MTRVRWSQRERKVIYRPRRKGPPTEIDWNCINQALASNDPEQTLTSDEVRAVCRLEGDEIGRAIKRGIFPPAKNPEAYGWRVWYAQDIRDYLEEHGMPISFNERAA
jgi:hypothetical protein